jgi:UDP-sulfoquinovose synthase
MQGPVFGVHTAQTRLNPELITRFDYDEIFGTVINRFCAQVLLNHPLTIYGEGGQTRGYLPIQDSMDCITLAIENPPKLGEYRVFNQFERTYSVNELANIVAIAGSVLGYDVNIAHYENPRKELESHYYNPHRQKLVDLGYRPTTDITEYVTKLIEDLEPYTGRLDSHRVLPSIRWDIAHRYSKII